MGGARVLHVLAVAKLLHRGRTGGGVRRRPRLGQGILKRVPPHRL